MNTSLFKGVGYVLVTAYLGLAVSACNTTKATADTIVKFWTRGKGPTSQFVHGLFCWMSCPTGSMNGSCSPRANTRSCSHPTIRRRMRCW